MTFPPDFRDWYWQIGSDTTQFFASARGIMVPSTDATFQAWSVNGNIPIKTLTIATLGATLAQAKIRPTDAAVLAVYQQASASAIDLVIGRILFNHENRIRALEAKAPITAAQFTAVVAALL